MVLSLEKEVQGWYTMTGQQKKAKKRGQCPITIHGIHYPTVDGNTLQHTATHCNTLQHTATHCQINASVPDDGNTMQHNATPYMIPSCK